MLSYVPCTKNGIKLRYAMVPLSIDANVAVARLPRQKYYTCFLMTGIHTTIVGKNHACEYFTFTLGGV